MRLSNRCQILNPSSTLAINALAKQRAKSGLPVFNLSTGEPDSSTPENIQKAGIDAIKNGLTKYTAVGGMIELKEAIRKKYLQDLNIEYSNKQITCANGGKQILYNLFQVLLNENDEVLVFSPYWVSYKSQVELAGGKLIEIPLSGTNNFAFNTSLIEQHLTEKTKAILLNSPSNPTGQILNEENIGNISKIAQDHNLYVISDDVYEHFYFTQNKPKHILHTAPHLKNNTINVNAVSKTYAMTGWRLGFATGPEEIIQKMEALQSHSASNPSSISQIAALEALTGPQASVKEMRNNFLQRRNNLITLLNGIKIIVPDGAFYLMINIEDKKRPNESDLNFCLDLLKETGVATVPGECFGDVAASFIRISFANSMDIIEQGVKKFIDFRK